MKTCEVVFAPEAEEPLAKLYRDLSNRASAEIAERYVSAILDYCEGLQTVPHRGTRRGRAPMTPAVGQDGGLVHFFARTLFMKAMLLIAIVAMPLVALADESLTFVLVDPSTGSASMRTASVMTDPKEMDEAVSALQRSLSSRLGAGNIAKCSVLIREGFGQGFTAVGGFCEVSFPDGPETQWMICYDDGVGNFAASTKGAEPAPISNFAPIKSSLAQFVGANCAGG